MPTTFNNIAFPSTTEKVNWGSHFAGKNLTSLVSDIDRQAIFLTLNNVVSSWELKVIYPSGQRECSWSFPHFINFEMKMIFLALIVQCCINFTSVQAFVITRASHGRDAFKIPASICKPNGTQSGSDCKSFYAVDGARNCSCMCPAKNATFAYYDRRGWSCVENQKLRRHLTQGKRILFIKKNPITWRSILNVETKLLSLKKGHVYLVIYLTLVCHQYCRVLFQTGSFLEPHVFHSRRN